jgi:hypothetical protein
MKMFDFFKNKKGNSLDVKSLRDVILQAVKSALQQMDGGEGAGMEALTLFAAPLPEERFLYETALYTNDPEKFRAEIQRIADNFALDLPLKWKFDIQFTAELPPGIIWHNDIKIGIAFKSRQVLPVSGALSARLTVLSGIAEQEMYEIGAGTKRINIGREKNVQAADGSFRANAIVFPADVYEGNKYVSRQHAHLEWDEKSICFLLYADEGGVPPANKTKIRTSADEMVHKLNSTEVGYPLRDGDQIILGESVVMEFTQFFT